MQGDSDNRNLVLAAVLAMLVVFLWQVFVVPPRPPVEQPATGEATTAEAPPPSTAPGGASPGEAPPEPAGAPKSRAEALAASPRVPLRTPSVAGSISLIGGRLDDLHLLRYRETIEPDSDTVVLLNPENAPDGYFVYYGWRRTAAQDPGPLPGRTTKWTVESGTELAPGHPVVLRWENGQGLVFHRKFEIDENYLVTVTQSVENTTGEAVMIAPYGVVVREGEPEGVSYRLVHRGAVGVLDGTLKELRYKDIRKLDVIPEEFGPAEIIHVKDNGWLGFTDKYWMTTLVPKPGQSFDAVVRLVKRGELEEFRTETRLPVMSVPAGGTISTESHVFSGAKEVATIRAYQEALGIDRFEDAVDWGWFYFLTKPIFRLLAFLHGLVGNMGLAIILLTFLVKAALFPLAYKSFVAMSKMKQLQPEMEKIKERVGDDRQKMQQELMALYKKEKVNPAAGCLPILLQIPIFFSLYKVLWVTIEMRHAPFIGWIRDLSAPDPSSWINLFGLLPWDVPPILQPVSIGFLPILMGVTMWLQQRLNPTPTDPTQKMIFAWMPWVFMFMLGHFASGLVLYWTTNNILSFIQQYVIMRMQGIEVDLLGNITSSIKPKAVSRPKGRGGGRGEAPDGKKTPAEAREAVEAAPSGADDGPPAAEKPAEKPAKTRTPQATRKAGAARGHGRQSRRKRRSGR